MIVVGFLFDDFLVYLSGDASVAVSDSHSTPRPNEKPKVLGFFCLSSPGLFITTSHLNVNVGSVPGSIPRLATCCRSSLLGFVGSAGGSEH